MPIYARMLTFIAGFLALAGTVYLLVGRELLGGPMIVGAAGAAAYVAVYLRRAVRVADRGPQHPPVELPHVGPTIWPLVLALAPIALAVGLFTAPWLIVVAVLVLALAGVGWVYDVRQQHRAHTGH